MPDNDKWLKVHGGCWKKPYKAAKGCGDALLGAQRMEDFRDAVRQHLPETLEPLALAVARDIDVAKLPRCRRRMPKRSVVELSQINMSL